MVVMAMQLSQPVVTPVVEIKTKNVEEVGETQYMQLQVTFITKKLSFYFSNIISILKTLNLQIASKIRISPTNS